MKETLFTQISLVKIKGILLDLDDTLYCYQRAHDQALEAIFEHIIVQGIYTNLSEFKFAYKAFRQDIVTRLSPQGCCRSRLLAFQKMCEEKKIKNPYIFAELLDRIYWKEFLYTIKINPEALEFLKQCKFKNIPICIVTDMTSSIQIQKIEVLKITEYIDHLVTSEEIGEEKPSSKMFLSGLKKLGLKPEEVIMIGDDFNKDIIGSSKIGIKGYLVKSIE